MHLQIEIPQEIRVKYLERRQQDLETLKSSLRTRTFGEFKRIGHQLKGNAASFGYQDLEKIAIAMENAAAAQDTYELGRQIEAFENWFKSQQQS